MACGHPWIFSGAISSLQGDPASSDGVVRVEDEAHQPLGWGLYSPNSQIRVRMFAPPGEPFDGALDAPAIAARLERAVALRRRLGYLSTEDDPQACSRLVNSEGDSLPGMMLDRFGPMVVLQLTTLPMVQRRDAIVAAIRQVLGEEIAIREIGAPRRIAEIEGFTPQEGWLHGPDGPQEVIVREGPVRFVLRPEEGSQKTGHFLDIREQRAWVGQRARGCRVLDAYSYTGGFGLHAAARGAAEVVCVDSSADAIEAARRNAAHNGFDEVVRCEQSKVDNYLRSAYDRGLRFEVVILDPPKLAPNRRAAKKALKLYEALSVQALRLLEPGGLFVLSSCSEAVGFGELERVMTATVARLGRQLQVVNVASQAADHPWPAAMSEGRYLSVLTAACW